MNPDASDGTQANDAWVSVFQAFRLQDDTFIVHVGGEVSLVDRETLTLLLRQMFPKEKP